MYFRDALAVVVCYDLTNPESFEKIKILVEDVRDSNIKDCAIYVVGMKGFYYYYYYYYY